MKFMAEYSFCPNQVGDLRRDIPMPKNAEFYVMVNRVPIERAGIMKVMSDLIPQGIVNQADHT